MRNNILRNILNIINISRNELRAGRQARERFDKKLDEAKVTFLDSKETPDSVEESAPALLPQAPTQISNLQGFEIKQTNNFDKFPYFFENLLDKADINLRKSQQAKREFKVFIFILFRYLLVFVTQVYNIAYLYIWGHIYHRPLA